MTVYVYELSGQRGLLFGRTPHPSPWFGLTAETDDEVHAFAVRLGLSRNMFQPGEPTGPQQAAPTGQRELLPDLACYAAPQVRSIALGRAFHREQARQRPAAN